MNILHFKNSQNNAQKGRFLNKNTNNNYKEKDRHKSSMGSNHSYCYENKNKHSDQLVIRNQIEEVFARTFILNDKQLVNKDQRNRSCIQFKKQRTKTNISKLMCRRDEQKQTDQQSLLRKKRKLSHSYQKNYKKIDHVLAQSIQERTQYYSNFPKKARDKSQTILHTDYQDIDQKSYSEIINFNKLVLWTQSKMQKVINQFYGYISFSAKFKGLIKHYKKEEKDRILIQSLKMYLMQRFKTEKLSKQNFINLTYSLQVHLKKSLSEYSNNLRPKNQLLITKIRFWKIFDRILTGQYDYEDIIFYLYMRNLFHQIINTKYSEQLFFQINEIVIKDFLNKLTNYDGGLVGYYLDSLKKMSQKNYIDRESILQFILNDFKVKKEYTKRKIKSQKNQEKICQDKGQRTISFDKHFWNRDNTFTAKVFTIQQKMRKQLENQCIRLVHILCSELNQIDKKTIQQLITAKALRILYALVHQNKQKVYEQYDIAVSQISSDQRQIINLEIQKLRSLAKGYMNIQKQSNHIQLQFLSKFLKDLLVCKPFLIKLQKLLDSFHDQ